MPYASAFQPGLFQDRVVIDAVLRSNLTGEQQAGANVFLQERKPDFSPLR